MPAGADIKLSVNSVVLVLPINGIIREAAEDFSVRAGRNVTFFSFIPGNSVRLRLYSFPFALLPGEIVVFSIGPDL
jgi:hypothetical protein